MQITITDQITDQVATVERDDVAETIRPWFPAAPQEVYDAIDRLQGQVNRGEYTGETETNLAIRIEYLPPVL